MVGRNQTLPARRVVPRLVRVNGADIRLAALLILMAALVGTAITAGLGVYLAALGVISVFVILGLRDWRFSVAGLIVWLPYSGLVIIAAYPSTGPATLLKDLMFVIPAYLGFAATHLIRHRDASIPFFPLGIVAIFAAIVLLQLLNPTLPNVVVGLIGAKVWLMYIPLAYVGYHFVRTKDDLRYLLFLMCAASVVPCVVGIVEGVLVNTGHSALVYSWYGDAASAVTQQFVEVGVGSTTINRVPSTFSFVGQYYLFSISMVSVAYAYWRGFLARDAATHTIGVALFMLVMFAALLTGARGAVLAAPVMVFMMLALDGVALRVWLWLPLGATLALAGAATVFGTSLGDLLTQVIDHGLAEFTLNAVDGFRHAFGHTYLGLGTGVDTVSARYALPAFEPYRLVGGRLEESWWVKSLLELGVVGLTATVMLMLTLSSRVVTAHRRIVDPQLRSVSSAIVTLVAFVLFYNFKGSFLDLDPTNVYFWLFIGVLFRLPELDQEAHVAPEQARVVQSIRQPALAMSGS